MTEPRVLLELDAVSMHFGGLRANRDVTLSVPEGTVMGLIGPNGAGKTTLFNCITGFLRPTLGAIRLEGKRIDGKRPDQICRLGLARTWQNLKPLAGMTALENVMVGSLSRTGSLRAAREDAARRLATVRLEAKAGFLASALAMGERKRLEIARVLATQPRIVLFDEVMGGLNQAEREDILELVLELRKQGLTQVVIEHDMKAIMRVSDRVTVLSSGEVIARGTPAEVAADPAVIDAYLGRDPDEAETTPDA